MHANQTDVQKILGGVQQYVIPLFQRPYSWERKQWEILWEDLVELCDEAAPRNHFIGSVVTMPAKSVPEGVSKFVLIDGQQRLTTLLVLFAAVRDKARRDGDDKLANKIDDLSLKNRYQDGTDVYKLLPTQDDRAQFFAVMDAGTPTGDGRIGSAHAHFEKKLRGPSAPLLERIYTVVCKHLVLVSIVLDKDDNPYLIFESLNAKGQPLAQADLIRNFFFMRVHPTAQDKLFRECWQPMQERLGKHLTEFLRHFLMRNGAIVRQGDVYFTVKEHVDAGDEDDISTYLRQIATFSSYYARLLHPEREASPPIATRLARLNRFEATTAYPFLLNVYDEFASGRLTEHEFVAVLDVLESFLIRRFVCGVPTNTLRKIFVSLFAQASGPGPFVDGVERVLADKNFPGDVPFREQFATMSLYGGGDRRDKAKLILDRLEASFDHKEATNVGGLTIEHVMPQTLTDKWKADLGCEWESVHDRWIDTVGNLTLTGYNPELSNSDFTKKKTILASSHVELNRYFTALEVWTGDEIAERGSRLAELAARLWPDFAPRGDLVEPDDDDEPKDSSLDLNDVLAALGGSVATIPAGRFKVYRLPDGRVVNLKYSRPHAKYYWFGLHASLFDGLKLANATHLVLVLGQTGFAAVPMDVVARYVSEAGSSPKSDGSVRHYHVLVSISAAPELFHHGKPTRVPLAEYLTLTDPAPRLSSTV